MLIGTDICVPVVFNIAKKLDAYFKYKTQTPYCGVIVKVSYFQPDIPHDC